MISTNNFLQFRSIIEKSNMIHLYTHAYPDGDAISSVAAMYHFLLSSGKKVICRCDTKLSPMYKWFEISINNKRNLESPDCIIVVDVGQTHQLGKLFEFVKGDFAKIPVINIDHHVLTNDKFGTVNLVYEAASTTQILYSLFKKWEFNIDKKIADILLYGLISDTYFFQKSNTTPEVLSLAAKLAELGADPSIVAQLLHKSKSVASISFWGKILASIEVFDNGQLALAVVSKDDFLNNDIEEYELNLDGLVNFMTAVETAKITVMMKERKDEIRVSFRSDFFKYGENWAAVNVSKIARKFGGGGHATASGCALNVPLAIAKELIVGACLEGLKENLVYKVNNKNGVE